MSDSSAPEASDVELARTARAAIDEVRERFVELSATGDQAGVIDALLDEVIALRTSLDNFEAKVLARRPATGETS